MEIKLSIIKKFCRKCKKQLVEYEEHHVWPKYMDNPRGLTYKNYPNRICLCSDHHVPILHKKIIIPILKEFSLRPALNSEYSLWKNVPISKRNEVIDKVVKETVKWVGEK